MEEMGKRDPGRTRMTRRVQSGCGNLENAGWRCDRKKSCVFRPAEELPHLSCFCCAFESAILFQAGGVLPSLALATADECCSRVVGYQWMAALPAWREVGSG
jgi:hypothetical protein